MQNIDLYRYLISYAYDKILYKIDNNLLIKYKNVI